MKNYRSGSFVAAVALITLGVLFLFLNLFSGFRIGGTWPAIFFILSAAFCVPAFLWPDHRQALAALFIPGAILLTLGFIFTFNVITGDWASWAYAWILIPGGVGLGMLMAGWYGQWGKVIVAIGTWMLLASLVFYSLFAALFGALIFKIIGPLVMVLAGGLLVWRSLVRK